MILRYENFLNLNDLEYIKNTLINYNKKIDNEHDKILYRNLFPWTFQYDENIGGVEGSPKKKYELTSIFFEHSFYYEIYNDSFILPVKSSYIDIIQPLIKNIENLKNIDFNKWFRIKGNLYIGRGKPSNQYYHIDFLFPHWTGLYMINSCDGGIFIEDNFYEHVENTLLIFDGSLKHKPINPINNDYKLNINLSFFANVNGE